MYACNKKSICILVKLGIVEFLLDEIRLRYLVLVQKVLLF